MKYLHVIPPSTRMMKGYIQMINDSDHNKEHLFVSKNNFQLSDIDLLEYENVLDFGKLEQGRKKQFAEFKNLLKEAEIVLWHCFKPNREMLLFMYANRNYLKKTIWVTWGIDIYNWKKTGKGYKTPIYNYMVKRCMKNMLSINVPLETDVMVPKEKIGLNKSVFVTPYCIRESLWDKMDECISREDCHNYNFNERIKELVEEDDKVKSIIENLRDNELSDGLISSISDKIYSKLSDKYSGRLLKSIRNENGLRILVGHNAYHFNNHIQSLSSLNTFKDDDIELLLPISYGGDSIFNGKKYKDFLISHAKRSFGDKAIFIKRFFEQSEYTDFLSMIDVAIFNAERQSGLGNILKLLYMDKKVYMNKNNPLFSFLTDKGFVLLDVDDLEDTSIDDLSTPQIQDDKAKQWIEQYYHPRYAAKLWDNLIVDSKKLLEER